MNAVTTETETETANCHRCHGTGSGLYNVFSFQSTCEVCGGTGLATPAQSPAAPAIPAAGTGARR